MILDGFLALCLLALPVAYPTIRLVGLSPATLFLLPLAGGLLAALGTVLELGIGGTVLGWYVVLCIGVNAIAMGGSLLWRRGADVSEGHPGSRLGLRPRRLAVALLTFVVVAIAVAWPLQPLRARILGYDTNAVWIVHAIEIYGGHSALFSGIHAPQVIAANPDYPPVIPASAALGFTITGHVVYDMEAVIAAVFNACAVAVLACGIAAATRFRTWAATSLALLVAAAVCLTAFGVAGVYAVSGYADLLWSAAAAAAVVYGLVLPSTSRNLAMAWLCATVAALTKNEGLAMAIVVFLLSSIRFIPAPRQVPSVPGHTTRSIAGDRRTWIERLLLAGAMAIPGVLWAVVVRRNGIHDAFFAASGGASRAARVAPTVSATWHYLHILPFVMFIALIGVTLLRAPRRSLRLGNDGWLWAVLCFSLVITAATYVFGSFEIHWWLSTSVDRTMIFPQLILFTDAGIWIIVALSLLESGGRTQIALNVDDAQVQAGPDELPSLVTSSP
jgi:hypothetical protein